MKSNLLIALLLLTTLRCNDEQLLQCELRFKSMNRTGTPRNTYGMWYVFLRVLVLFTLLNLSFKYDPTSPCQDVTNAVWTFVCVLL